MSVFGAINTKQSSVPYSVPAPVGGLNGRDPLANMDPQDAYLMDNLYPEANKVVARNGTEKHTNTELEGPVETLEVYSGAGSEVMLAWAGTKVYNVSAATPVEIASGITEPYVQTAMFSNAADNAQWLIAVNGADTPRGYNGVAMSTLTYTATGLSPADLVNVLAFKGRLYFAEKDKLGFWYGGTGLIQGSLSYFDLGQVSKLGGYLVAMATYSQASSGDTPNDYIVFITSRGECIVYSGSDPGDATAWGIIGRYYAATPIGRKCAFNFNSELIILTLDGAIPFSEVRRSGDSEGGGVVGAKYGAVTTKLGRYLSEFNINSQVKGWHGLQYPRGGWLLVNVPETSSQSGKFLHYVMNASTGSWCRFTGWDGLCFTVFNDKLYFGRYDGHVMVADQGANDDGKDININVKQAYNYFNGQNDVGNVVKHFQWAEVFIRSNGTPPLSGSFSVNFNEREPDYLTGVAEPEGSEWDNATWGVSGWAPDSTIQTAIITLNRGGFSGSLWLRASLTNISFEWFATQFVMGRTSGLLV